MEKLDDIVEDFVQESEVDYISLPEIVSAAQYDVGVEAADDVRNVSLEIVRRLYERGMRPGDYWGSDFDYWSDEGCQPALDRIEREWVAAGADPNLGAPICWFAPRPQ